MKLSARPIDPVAHDALLRAGVTPLLARLFAARGVGNINDIDADLAQLARPEQLKGIATAAELLADAIAARRRITVIADYDCDGATACAVAVRGLRLFGAEVDYLVPNRFEYGYGLTPEIVELAALRTRPDLIVTVDNGIASVEGVGVARARGIDVLITDHHLAGDQLPDASAIVNPNQPGCTFPSKHLAGVGVMFYVLLALRRVLRERDAFGGAAPPRLDHLLDLVALGTVADVVRLDANNRRLVAQGLKRIRAGTMQPGIAKLYQVAGREARSANAFDLGFALGPRLNAAGRLADMALGIECLVTDDVARAEAIAIELDTMNRERRSIEAGMQDSALAILDGLEAAGGVSARTTICLFDENWHQGVVGILAARLRERFHRATIAFAPASDGTLRGSGRSIAGLHLRDVLDRVAKRHPRLIEKFGGHAMAAGLTIARADFAAFVSAFEEAVTEVLDPALLARTIEVDGPLAPSEASTRTVRLLADVVWGQGFAPPLFCDRFDVLRQRILKDKHLKLSVKSASGQIFDAIWFNHAETLAARVQLAYRLTEDSYAGTPRLQLVIEHCFSDEEAAAVH